MLAELLAAVLAAFCSGVAYKFNTVVSSPYMVLLLGVRPTTAWCLVDIGGLVRIAKALETKNNSYYAGQDLWWALIEIFHFSFMLHPSASTFPHSKKWGVTFHVSPRVILILKSFRKFTCPMENVILAGTVIKFHSIFCNVSRLLQGGTMATSEILGTNFLFYCRRMRYFMFLKHSSIVRRISATGIP